MDKESAKRRKLNRIGLIYSTCYLLLGVLIKCYVWYDATKFLREKKISVDRMMVTPMPFTSFYWYVLAENNNEYRVNYRSIFKSNLDTAVVIQRGRMRIQDLAWDGKNFSPELQSVTNGYYYIEQHRDTIITYDLRFGLLTKLTNGKSNLPIMGYQMEAKNHRIIKTIPLSPRKQLAKVDFKQYFKAVFGLNDSFPK